MVLNIVAVALVLGITFMNSIFGLFSGILNVVCTVFAAVAAFGFWEPLNAFLIGTAGFSPNLAGPFALITIFLVTLLILRTIADTYIRGNVRVPPAVDWAGGTICGFIAAEIIVGVLVISLLMLPFGGELLGYSGIVRTDETTTHQRVAYEHPNIWLQPDRFATGVVKLLSAGSLSGAHNFASAFPDFGQWVRWTSNTVQPESLTAPLRDSKRGDAFEKGLQVVQWWEQTGPIETRYRKDVPTKDQRDPPYTVVQFAPESGNKLIGVELKLDRSSADRDKSVPHHRLRPTQLRLVGEINGTPHQYTPDVLVNIDSKIQGRPRLVNPVDSFALPSEMGGNVIRMFFEVPTDFTPSFVEYRRFVRQDFAKATKLDAPPDSKIASLQTPEERQAEAAAEARGFLAAIKSGSGDATNLPFQIKGDVARRAGVETRGADYVSGRIFGARDAIEASDITNFAVPEGYRLLQVRVDARQARSLAGQVFNYVARTVNQYYAVDNAGDRHLLSGYFAVVKRNGQEYAEIYYTGQPDDPTFRGLLDFKQIEPAELDDEGTELGLLFLVPPGTTVRAIQNQTGEGPDGLTLKVR